MKKTYHSACKEEKLAASRETNSKLESNNNPESQKKLQEKVEKCQQEVQKVGLPVQISFYIHVLLHICFINDILYDTIDYVLNVFWLFYSLLSYQTKERYEKSLEELDKVTPQYMENMEQVFEQWQQFEDKRIHFFKDLFLEVKQHLDLSANHR